MKAWHPKNIKTEPTMFGLTVKEVISCAILTYVMSWLVSSKVVSLVVSFVFILFLKHAISDKKKESLIVKFKKKKIIEVKK